MVTSQVLKKISMGDQEAFKVLFDSFHGKLFELARYYSRSDEIAEEVTNDVFVKIWNKRSKLTSIKKIESYLFIATRNEILSYLRTNKKELAVMSINQVELNLVLQIHDEDKSFIDKELLQSLEESIKNLPEKSGIVFRMVKEDEMSYKEVAKIMNISIKSVEKHVGIAFKRIRSDMKSYLIDHDINYKNIIISALAGLFFTFI